MPSSPATEARLWSGLFSSHPSAPSADFFFFLIFFPLSWRNTVRFVAHMRDGSGLQPLAALFINILLPSRGQHTRRPGGLCGLAWRRMAGGLEGCAVGQGWPCGGCPPVPRHLSEGGIGWAFKAGFSRLLHEVTSGGGRRSAAVNLRSLNYACGGGFMFWSGDWVLVGKRWAASGGFVRGKACKEN